MVEVRYQTLGEAFIEDLNLAKKSKSSLFEFLIRTIQKDNPEADIRSLVSSITDSESLINYYDVLSRLQIERNSKSINSIRRRLQGMHSIQHPGDSTYANIMKKKLNILSSMTIGLKEHLYMIINCYVREMSFGDVKQFKEEFLEYLGETLHQGSGFGKKAMREAGAMYAGYV